MDEDVRARIGKARAALNTLHKLWKARAITTSTKIRIFNTNVKSVLLYGLGTWRTTKAMLAKEQAFINTHTHTHTQVLEKNTEATEAGNHQERRYLEDGRVRTGKEADLQTEVDMDWAHTAKGKWQHHEAGFGMESGG